MGDPLAAGRAATDLGLYGSSHVGLMAACIETSNVPGILQLDLLATDFYLAAAYPTYLYFNPYLTNKVVQMNAGTAAVDIYDAVANDFMLFNVSGTVSLGINAKAAVMPVLIPANAEIQFDGTKMLAGGVTVDYRRAPAATVSIVMNGSAMMVRSIAFSALDATNILQRTGSLNPPSWSNVASFSGVESTNWAFPVPTDSAAFFRVQTAY
jgi:hypothetical protein